MAERKRTERIERGLEDPEALRAEIERTRAELAETVDQLSDRLNVKERASRRAGVAKDRASETASRAKASSSPHVRHALDRTGEKVSPVAHQVSEQAAPHRRKIVAGALAAGAVVMVARRRHARSGS